jgi:NTP pyrophosphatase (non-canonical NTP hydrolase)
MTLLLNKYADYIKGVNLKKGFDGVPDNIETPENAKALIYALALVITETAEAIEAVRNQDVDNLSEELADTIIRILHITSVMGIDIEAAILDKMRINEGREYLHGKAC